MCNSKYKRNYITIDLYCLKTHLVSLNPSQIASTAANFIIVLGQFVSQIRKTTKGTVWFVPKTFRKINSNYTREHRIRRKSTASRIYVSARGAPRAKVSYWNQQTAPHTYREVVEFVMFFFICIIIVYLWLFLRALPMQIVCWNNVWKRAGDRAKVDDFGFSGNGWFQRKSLRRVMGFMDYVSNVYDVSECFTAMHFVEPAIF